SGLSCLATVEPRQRPEEEQFSGQIHRLLDLPCAQRHHGAAREVGWKGDVVEACDDDLQRPSHESDQTTPSQERVGSHATNLLGLTVRRSPDLLREHVTNAVSLEDLRLE